VLGGSERVLRGAWGSEREQRGGESFGAVVAASVVVGCHLGEDLDFVAGVAQQRHAREREVERAGDRGHEVVVVAQVPALVRDDRGQLLVAEEVERAGADDDRLVSVACGDAVNGRGVVIDDGDVEAFGRLSGELEGEQVRAPLSA
jgi:hypothetical protein